MQDQEAPGANKPSEPETAPEGSAPAVAHRSFLKQGKFESTAQALHALSTWCASAQALGYAISSLAAWITITDKIRVQLATRGYWRHLTPRGPARDALAMPDGGDALRCLVFRKGRVESALLAELAAPSQSDADSAFDATEEADGLTPTRIGAA